MRLFRKKETEVATAGPTKEIHIHLHGDPSLERAVALGEAKHQEILDRATDVLNRLEAAVDQIEVDLQAEQDEEGG